MVKGDALSVRCGMRGRDVCATCANRQRPNHGIQGKNTRSGASGTEAVGGRWSERGSRLVCAATGKVPPSLRLRRAQRVGPHGVQDAGR